MEAMIFAAGLGTRLRPLTDFKPKALMEVNGTTLLERTVSKMVSFGIHTITVNIHHFPDMMVENLNALAEKYNCRINISDERNMLLDTGGGLLYARKFFSEKKKLFSEKDFFFSENNFAESYDENCILLHNVDVLSNIDFNDMKKAFVQSNCLALLCVQQRQTSRYLIFNENLELSGWVNNATNQKIITRKCNKEHLFAFSGVHIISKDIFEKINLSGKFSVTDMYLQLSAENIIKPYIYNGLWLDAGKKESLEKAAAMF